MLSESQIREQVDRLLAGELSLDDFQDWFAAQSWNMHKWADEHLRVLIGRLELVLAEDRDESEGTMFEHLRAAVEGRPVFRIGHELPTASSAAPNQFFFPVPVFRPDGGEEPVAPSESEKTQATKTQFALTH